MQITLAGDCLTNDAYVKPCDQKSGGDECQTCHKPPMARYSAHSMLASLNIEDTPFRYTPARGPNIDFTVTYNQRGDQPTTVDYPNLGPQWTFNWLSYVTDNPNDSTSAQVFVPSGGVESYSNFDEESGSYAADPQSHAVLVRVSSNPIKYEKRFPDGSVTAYAQSDTSSSPRKIFMTEIFDPVGNKVTVHYNGLSTQIQSIEDALGYETALVYDENDGMRIVGVTEPTQFGSRSASFSYNTDGQLKKITDEIGIQSQFTYTTGTNFIDSLQTPYGTSHFCSGQSGTNRWVEMTDPLGGKERVEYRDNAPGISAADSSNTVPNGFTNDRLDVGNTFYWDKKAILMYPPVCGVYDYTKARIIHWLFNSDGSVSGIASSEKAPLENRVWYAYDNQPDFAHAGPSANPIKVARILDDSSAKLWQYSYNSAGNVTQEIDPRVRVRTYSYDTNNIDLLTVHQGTDAIASYAYDPDSEPPHRPKTVTDAAGQITTYHYNSQGQVLTVTNPKSEVTTYAYDRDQNSDGDTDGYLISITSPTFGTSHATTTFAYDNAKRVHTVTNSPDNYTVTTDYDNLDRPTQITYPDGTNQQFQYTDNVTSVMTLDLTGSKDRLDRWTYRHYNGNRQMDSMIDPLGQTTLYNWCTCGSLVGITDPNGNVTTFNRDLQSRVYSKVFADSSATTYAYENTTSRLKSMTDALGQTTNYQYFGDDDLQQVSYTNALISTPTVSYTYDLNYNRVLSMADGTGTTNYHYNSPPIRGANQLYQVDGPLSNDTITYTYDELGRALTQDINGTTASVVYDSLGRLYTTTNALGTFTRLYESDVTPRLHSLTYPNGQTANYHYYDNSGDRRLQTLQHLTSGLVNLSQHDYSYDPEGQIQSWTKTLGTDETDLSFTYDDAKQLTNVSRAQDNLQSDYGYDYAGNRLSASTYTPAHGHAPNGTFFNYTANALNQLDSVAETLNTDPQDPVAITYDANGNMTYDGGNQTFEWDAANRLVAITYLDSGNRTEFAYDGLNRRVRITEIGPGITATIQPSGSSYATFNTASFLLLTGTYTLTLEGLNPTGGDNTVFVDDITLNGTLVTNGSFESPPVSNYVYRPSDATWSFQTDSGIVSNGSGFGNVSTLYGTQAAFVQFNGVISQTFNTSGGTFTLGFKAAQRGSNVQQLRVTVQPYPPPPTVVKNFVWCGNQICEERDSTGSTVTKRFFAEGEQRVGGSDAGNYYYSRDHLGSIREVTDSTGALKSQFDYDAWGNSVVVSGNMNVDFGYTGEYFHAPSSMNLSKYRAYNPTLGRWISRDPIGEGGGINLYGYVGNEPLLRVDPLGLQDEARPPGIDGPGYYGAGTRNAQSLAADAGPLVEAGGRLGYGCKGKDFFEREISDRIEALFDFLFKLVNVQDAHPTDPIKK
jgi:RHS repeat-associated protein